MSAEDREAVALARLRSGATTGRVADVLGITPDQDAGADAQRPARDGSAEVARGERRRLRPIPDPQLLQDVPDVGARASAR